MKILGYDFNTREPLKLYQPADFYIDDVAVIRRNGMVNSITKVLGKLSPTASGTYTLPRLDDIDEAAGKTE